MKRSAIIKVLFAIVVIGTSITAKAQTKTDAPAPMPADAKAKSDADVEKRATDWVASLNLNDKEKKGRVSTAISTHLKAVRDWNNDHSYTSIPEGIDPSTGKKLSVMDRTIIINSTLPKTVHADLLAALHKDLNDEQVELILDKYTEGKVAFTLNGYKSIVPDLKPEEEATILANLKQAREQAIDFKGSKQISAIFEIYKTRNEQYLNSNGRNWHKIYGDYSKMINAKKAADAAAKQQKN